jgi:UDP-glucuronate 4-epimerase
VIDVRRILVTGGAGFIGSHLCERLLHETQAALVVVDNFDPFYSRSIKEANLASFRTHPRVHFVELDLRDGRRTRTLYDEARPDMVIHLAAKAGVRPSIADPSGYVEANVGATTRLLELAAGHATRSFLFVSSSSVYGDSTPVPFREDARVDAPISPYAATKRACELIASTFHQLYGIGVACARLFTVYGPRQRPDLAIHNFARRILDGKAITLFGDGTSARDYTYVDDIIDGLVRCAGWLVTQRSPPMDVFNLGGASPVSLGELVTALEVALGRRAIVERAPRQPGDVVRTYASIERAREAFGYAPQVDLASGLSRFVHWLRERRPATP